MILDRDQLLAEAERVGFEGRALEKVARLLHLLERINRDEYLTNRLALKGGTAIHQFYLEAPRLSVDLDFNYLGSADREAMLAERPEVERRLQELLVQEEYTIHRVPGEHAGGKWRLRYGDLFGTRSTLEVDLAYLYRVPLYPAVRKDSWAGIGFGAHGIALVSFPELAAGKLLRSWIARRAAMSTMPAASWVRPLTPSIYVVLWWCCAPCRAAIRWTMPPNE